MRVTVGMISSQYRNNLNSALERLNYYNNRSTTFRKFDQVHEDPVSAAQAFRLRREYEMNDAYQTNLRDAENLFLSAESSMMSVNKMIQEVASGDCLQAITGTTGSDGRAIIAKKLRETQNAILGTVNSKFADRFIFGGSSATQPPFSVGENGSLLFRGADVTTGMLEKGPTANVGGGQICFGKDNTALNGYTVRIQDGAAGAVINDTDKTITVSLDMAAGAAADDLLAQLKSLGNAAGADFSKVTLEGDWPAAITAQTASAVSDTVDLGALANEKLYVDLGLGLSFDAAGEIDTQSVFDVGMAGISFLGFGKNADGVPNNLYTLMGEIADQLESPNFSMDEIQPYLDSFEKQQSNLMITVTGLGTRSAFLENTESRLKDIEYNLNAKMNAVEIMDPAKAIMDFKMQEYAYRAALQMGMKVLQPTFLDFMN